jgi:Flp pilus assembly protein TadG
MQHAMSLPKVRSRIAARRRRSRGQSLVEFALVLPVFLVLMSTAVDLGRLAYARVAVTNAAREGSFQAALTPTSYQAGANCPASADSNLVICRTLLEAKGSVVSVVPADIGMTCTPDCTPGIGHTVKVDVTGHMRLITPFMAVFFGSYNVDFTASSTNQIKTLPTTTAMASAAPSASPSPSPSPSASPSVGPSPSESTCPLPSAGFTYTTSPSTNKSPVTVTVTDTSSSAPGCTISVWEWTWGDGSVTYGQVQAPHAYFNPGPAANKTFSLTLKVTTNTGFYSTTGAVLITVKK